MTNHHTEAGDPADHEPLAEPLRPTWRAEAEAAPRSPGRPGPSAPDTSAPDTSYTAPIGSVATGGPSKARVGLVVGAAAALAVGAVATSFAATPPATPTSVTQAAAPLAPAAVDPTLAGGDAALDFGRFGGGGFRDVTISAISGSNVTLTTDDGWTRTIAITGDVELTKGGQTIAVSDLQVGDEVRFRQTRNDDGTYTVTAVAVVVPSVSGTVSELSSTSFKVTTRDGSVWTITTDDATTYQFGPGDGTRADLANGEMAYVQGTSTGDNALTATSVTVAADRAVGTVTAKTGSTITIEQRDGTSLTVNVDADTTYRVAGVEDAGLDDITVGMAIGVQGRSSGDDAIDASNVVAGRGFGRGDGLPGLGGGFGRHGGGPGFGDDVPAPSASPSNDP